MLENPIFSESNMEILQFFVFIVESKSPRLKGRRPDALQISS